MLPDRRRLLDGLCSVHLCSLGARQTVLLRCGGADFAHCTAVVHTEMGALPGCPCSSCCDAADVLKRTFAALPPLLQLHGTGCTQGLAARQVRCDISHVACSAPLPLLPPPAAALPSPASTFDRLPLLPMPHAACVPEPQTSSRLQPSVSTFGTAERVRTSEAEEWLASRREDVEQHAAQTLEYDW